MKTALNEATTRQRELHMPRWLTNLIVLRTKLCFASLTIMCFAPIVLCSIALMYFAQFWGRGWVVSHDIGLAPFN